jgi:hypothetical protein
MQIKTRKQMSQLSNDELRALRWRLLGHIPETRSERDALHVIIKRLQKEIESRKLKKKWTQPN